MDLVGFLERLPREKLERLYATPTVCASVLRNLPPLAGQYVARLTFAGSGVRQGVLASWAVPGAAKQHQEAVDKLVQLGVLREELDKGEQFVYALDPGFQLNAKRAILSGCSSQILGPQPTSGVPTAEQRAAFAAVRWETLLEYLLGTGSSPPHPLPGMSGFDVAGLLEAAGIATRGIAETRCTTAGYLFLLAGQYKQLWMMAAKYIAHIEATDAGVELPAVVQFLLSLGALSNCSLPLDEVDAAERPVAEHMAQLGLLMPFSSDGRKWLCSTPLATMLMNGGISGVQNASGYIIVETNFRLYAYASSAVQWGILKLFVRCDVLLPNLFVGTITRESVMHALRLGITADDVVAYLRDNAHPRVRGNVPVVPGVVSDQIGLWEWETQRLQARRGVLYSNFESKAIFEEFVDFVERSGFGLSISRKDQCVAVPAEAHEACKAEIKRIKAMHLL